jgi:hypothetical protein
LFAVSVSRLFNGSAAKTARHWRQTSNGDSKWPSKAKRRASGAYFGFVCITTGTTEWWRGDEGKIKEKRDGGAAVDLIIGGSDSSGEFEVPIRCEVRI